MPMRDDVFVCEVCGSEALDSWPYVHCWKCGNREDRPDLGLDAKNQPIQTNGAVFGGGTPDDSSVVNVPTSQTDQAPAMSEDAAPSAPPYEGGTDL